MGWRFRKMFRTSTHLAEHGTEGSGREIGPVRCFEVREVRKETSDSEWIWWG